MALPEGAEGEIEEECADVLHGDEQVCYAIPQAEEPIKDAMSGQLLDRSLVDVARQKELKYFLAREVWLTSPRSEAYRVPGKRPVPVTWVDVSKGDGLNPNYRIRLVARDIRLPGGEAIFAPTPLLEAPLTVLSAAATGWKTAKKHIPVLESEH